MLIENSIITVDFAKSALHVNNKPTRHTHGYFLINMKRDIFTPKWGKLIKRDIGFKADTLEMIRFACLVMSIQQLPGFATIFFYLLEKST